MMHRRELLGALGALAAAGIAACAGRPIARRPRGPQVWRASRGTARVFVLGVAEAKNRSWWSAAVDRAFADSSELWFETPPQPPPSPSFPCGRGTRCCCASSRT